MREYKFYLVRNDGRVEGSPRGIELPDDLAALKEARSLANDHDVEIWQGARIVAYLAPGKMYG
jgi:hypothetical protein